MFHPEGPSLLELAEQALSSTRRGYDLLAPTFDRTPFRTPDPILRAVGRVVAAGPPARRALDICCGTGAGLEALAPHADELVGVDFSEPMLEVARRRLALLGIDAELRCQDVLQLPATGDFDVVTCCGALGHFVGDDEGRLLRVAHGLLRPGGSLILATSMHPRRRELAWWLSRGFNGAMHVRNAVLQPPFVMFYLTFTVPRVLDALRSAGFEADVVDPADPERPRLRIAVGRKARI